MPFPDPLHSVATREWKKVKEPEEKLLLTAAADVRANGSFGERWLVVTDQRVVVLPGTGSGEDGYLAIPLAEITEATTESLVGGGRLEVQQQGLPRRVIEYTNSQTPKFAEVARGIQQLAKGQPLAITDELPKLRCDKCGRLLPEKNGLCPKCVHKGAMALRLAGYLRPHWQQTALLATLALTKTGVQLLPPVIQKTIIDGVLTPPVEGANTGGHYGDFGFLVLMVLALVGAGLATSGADVAAGWFAASLSTRITAAVRSELYHSLERLSLLFHSKREKGVLMSVVTRDTDNLNYFLMDGIPYLLSNGLMLIGITLIMLLYSWQLTLIILIPAPLVVIGGATLWGQLRPLWAKVSQSWALFSAHLNESLAGIRVAKAFSQENAEIRRFSRKNADLADITIREGRLWFTAFAGLNFITSSGAFLAWLAGGRAVMVGDLTLGTLVAFIGYLWLLYGPLQWFNQIYNWMSRAMAGAERVFEIVDQEPEPYREPNAIVLPRIEGAVEFRDVTFGYDPSKPVLKDIAVSIKPGEMIGLVGKSGAGKSTFANLICRFYEADHGEVLIDGHDVRALQLESLRSQIGMVLQDQFLFNGTIADNIGYAKPEASRAELIAAARAANAHEFIVGKPDGYDTRVGENGGNLSGGEKQRIAIARAILRDPRILILDEATSSVDTETEHQIQQALARLVQGRTTFAIAHRLSTLRNANRLIVLDDGKLAEVGTHDELLASGGIYARLVKMQQEVSNIQAVAS